MLDKIQKSIKNLSPSLQQILSNTSWLVADQILRMGIGLFVGVWVARYLGPEQFGTFNYAMTFVTLFDPILKLGLDSIVVRDLAQKPEQRYQTLGSAFGLKLFGSIATFLLAINIFNLLDTQTNAEITGQLIAIISISTLFLSFDVISFWFSSQVQSKYVTFAKTSAYLLAASMRIFLVSIQAPLVAFAWAIFAELALGAVGLIIVYSYRGDRIFAWRFNGITTKNLIKNSSPLIIAGLMTYLYSKIDQVMLGTMLPDQTQLGFYAVAVKLSELSDFLPLTLNISMLPKLSVIKAKSEAEFLEKTQIYFDIMMLLWLSVAIPTTFLAPFVVNLLYGPAYASAASILSIYVWAQFGTNFGVARSTYMVINNINALKIAITCIGAIVNIIINYLLIPQYGALGATVATLITYFITNVFLNFIFPDLHFIGRCLLRSANLYQAVRRIRSLVS